MAFSKQVDRKNAQDQKIKKLKVQIERAEKQIADQALLRQKLEELINVRLARTDKIFDRKYGHPLVRTEKNDQIYRPSQNKYDRTRNKILEEMMSKRTREFQQSQAEKAAKIRYLTQERQQILEAHQQLRRKHRIFNRLPSPVGEATERLWGYKNFLYTPLQYDNYSHVFVPAFQDGYYTYFPHKKRKKNPRASKIVFVPTPLFQSL